MARRSDHSREELRELALSAAEAILAEEGLAGLSTRKVAQRMGYTVGTLYLVFQNLDHLILLVNARTLERLRVRLDAGLSSAGGVDPADRIQALCQAYYQFARQHLPLWRLVFEHRLPPAEPLPAWFEDRVGELLDMVSQELARLLDTQTPAEIRLAARTLWGSVHGICVLALGDKLSVGGEPVAAEQLIDSLVANYLAGLGHSRTSLNATTIKTDTRGRA